MQVIIIGRNTIISKSRQNRGPPCQATGPPRSRAGVGVGMLRGAGDSLSRFRRIYLRFMDFGISRIYQDSTIEVSFFAFFENARRHQLLRTQEVIIDFAVPHRLSNFSSINHQVFSLTPNYQKNNLPNSQIPFHVFW